MVDMDTNLTDAELVNEVRDSLAGMSEAKIPDDTIEQSAKRFVIPLLNDLLSSEVDQEGFDNVVIAWTAERSFSAWLAFTRMRDREIETYLDPQNYLSQLKERTDFALRVIDLTRPPQTPNEVVTIKHDGVKRKVDLDQHWVLD